MKICIKCRKSKDYSQFYKDKTRKDGYQNTCTPCRREQKGIIKREIEREIERKKAFYKKEKQREFDSHWSKFRANWTACEIYKNWAKKRHLKQTLKWGKKNPKKRKEIAKKYKENNKDKIKESRRIWIKNNREKYLKSKRIRNKEYRKKKNNDPMFIAIKRIRDRLQRSFKSRKWQKRSKCWDALRKCLLSILKANLFTVCHGKIKMNGTLITSFLFAQQKLLKI